MSDIFISYAKEDRLRLEHLAKALTAYGWDVFWDPTIPAGKTWRQVIGHEIEHARCVIVAWSSNSNNSHWVLEESEIGRERGVLIPIMIEEVLPPLGFRSLQAANLSTWEGDLEDANFQSLISDITSVLGEAPARPSTDKVQPPGEEKHVPTKPVKGKKKGTPSTLEQHEGVSSNSKYYYIGGGIVLIALLIFLWLKKNGDHGYSVEEDQGAWIMALREDHPDAFRMYLENFPNGMYIEEAHHLLDSLEDVFSWNDALEQNTIDAYQVYLDQRPEGRYSDDARKAIGKMDRDERRAREAMSANNQMQAWKMAMQQNTVAAYRAYQEKYPNGEFVEEARNRITELENAMRRERVEEMDNKSWESALASNTLEAYQRYADRFPDGMHAREANTRIRELESNSNNQRRQEENEAMRVNGRNVKVVAFGQQPNEILGEFVQRGDRYWVETGTRGEDRFEFKETNRDEWSVYLHDPGRDVRIQLDLNTRKVLYGEGTGNMGVLYNIYGAE